MLESQDVFSLQNFMNESYTINYSSKFCVSLINTSKYKTLNTKKIVVEYKLQK